MQSQQFLKKLQKEALLQAKLEEKKVLPQQLDWLGNLVINYSWKFLLLISFLTAFLWQVL